MPRLLHQDRSAGLTAQQLQQEATVLVKPIKLCGLGRNPLLLFNKLGSMLISREKCVFLPPKCSQCIPDRGAHLLVFLHFSRATAEARSPIGFVTFLHCFALAYTSGSITNKVCCDEQNNHENILKKKTNPSWVIKTCSI